jgi:hypothetical protein
VLGGDADGLGATDADDADGATLGGGNGADGVLGMAHKICFVSLKRQRYEKRANKIVPSVKSLLEYLWLLW